MTLIIDLMNYGYRRINALLPITHCVLNISSGTAAGASAIRGSGVNPSHDIMGGGHTLTIEEGHISLLREGGRADLPL